MYVEERFPPKRLNTKPITEDDLLAYLAAEKKIMTRIYDVAEIVAVAVGIWREDLSCR
jgi:hypothetical protein